LLTVGARLQLLDEQEQFYYAAQIKQVGRSTFTTGEAVAGDKKLNVEPGAELQVTLLGYDAVYYFNTRLAGIAGKEEALEYTFELPKLIHRHQRRSHVRVPCHLHVYFWSLDEAMRELARRVSGGDRIPLEDDRWGKGLLEELQEILPPRQGVSMDLSGGGLRMVSLEPVERQERLLLKICLDERCRSYFLLEGRIARVAPLAIGKWQRYRVGVAFTNISQGLQERIIRHIFRVMRRRV
jgi:c-di-GMP-binding flagellar brake protein YcgR